MKTLTAVALCLLLIGVATALKKRKTQPGEVAKAEDLPKWLLPEVQDYLESTQLEDLPEKLQKFVRAIGDTSHWCCAVATTQSVTTSHAVVKYYASSQHTKYYRGCGVWGWSRCSVRQTHYRHNVGYFTNYKSTIQQISCPDHHVVCCRGYLLVAEHCLPLSQIGAIKDDLIKLQQLGFVDMTKCTFQYTPWNDRGGGNAIYLDRHALTCSGSSALTFFRLENNGAQKIRYKYRCCTLPSNICTYESKPTPFNDDGNGNIIYLDRQAPNCGRGFIRYMRLQRNGPPHGKYRYDINCCTSKKELSCYMVRNGFTSDGGGAVEFLDRQSVLCNKNYYLSYFHLNRADGGSTVRYEYSCCKLS